MTLKAYRQKRTFSKTKEPKGELRDTGQRLFVVQEHHASRLHFDFRLQIGGVLKSWAVPKGPSLAPTQKRLAVQVEDHPVEYSDFEGEIAEGNYGAGQVAIWDRGSYTMVGDQDPQEAWNSGRMSFQLHGDKLRGQFNLVKMHNGENNWLLIKSNDRYAEPEWKLEMIMKSERKTVSRQAKPRARANTPARTHPSQRTTNRTPPKQTFLMNADQVLSADKLAGNVALTWDEDTVLLTHLDKVFWPADGYTKGDLIKYYMQIAPFLVPYLQDRPLILKRYPNGIDDSFFFQHEFRNAPPYLRTTPLESEGGRIIDYAIIDNTPSLLYLANLGTIEEHPWHSRIDRIDNPDWMVFDLDPAGGRGSQDLNLVEFRAVCEVALALEEVLVSLGLEGYPKTSGSRGIHVLIPIEPGRSYVEVAEIAESIANLVVAKNRARATVERSITKREAGRVYIDYLQNARGKTTAAPYSVRARSGAPVSTPLTWEEVRRGLSPLDFTITSVPRRLATMGDLYANLLHNRQSLASPLDQLARAR